MYVFVGHALCFSQRSVVWCSLLKYHGNWQICCRMPSVLCILSIMVGCFSRIRVISLRKPISISTVSILISSSWEGINQVFVTKSDAYWNYWCSQIPSMCTLCANGPLISSLVTRQSQISLRRTIYRVFPGNGGKWCLRMCYSSNREKSLYPQSSYRPTCAVSNMFWYVLMWYD